MTSNLLKNTDDSLSKVSYSVLVEAKEGAI